MEFNLADLWERVADTVPDHEALVCADRHLSFAEADSRATRLAHALAARGVGPGDHVACYLYNSIEYLEVMIAAFKLRAVPINVNYRYVEDELRYLFDDADVRAVVFHREFAPKLAAIHESLPKVQTYLAVDDGTHLGSGLEDSLLGVDDYETALATSSPDRDFAARSADDLYILYTGGTTGMPKGVMWRHEDVFFGALGGAGGGGKAITTPDEISERCLESRTRCVPACPFMHGTAHWMAFSTLFTGGTVVIPAEHRLDALKLWELVGRERANFMVIVGDAFARPMLDALDTERGRALDVSELRVLLSGGAILSPTLKRELVQRLPGVLVVDGYGASETGGQGQSVVVSGGDIPTSPQFRVSDDTLVLDDNLEPAAPGVVGRLARRGPIPLGYYKDPEKSAATFPVVNGVRWAVPGDHAVVDDDGLITLLGRGSVSINTGGEKVYPEEVESVLKGHADVIDAVVVGVPDTRWGEHVVAVVQPRPGTTPTLASLQDHAARASRELQDAARHRVGRRDHALPVGQTRLPLGEGNRAGRATRSRTGTMTNRLGAETSPYLHQHRDNPVDWYPWGDEAFEKARTEGKPIFLSVGYSSCHWCHVMAHESFEDPAIAEVMNRLFVNVKVDREERPDVDAVYMQAVQALTGRGGWPMSVWCTPDGRPFYGGTYFPNEDRHGMPAFSRVCEVVAEAWNDQREDVEEQAAKLTEAIDEHVLRPGARGGVDAGILATALTNVRSQFDPEWGGFGRAPKFPQAMTIDFMCRELARHDTPETREMITTTLDAMAAGGIHDQLGGGFARYSTDETWLVPHFEKMLYDNALLTRAYLHGFLVTGEERYRHVVEDIVGYVLRDLTDPAGGFYAAEDADSEGIEGKFYVWSPAEIREVCGEDADEVIRYYGVSDGGNFIDPHTNFRGSILHVARRNEPEPDAVTRCRPLLLARRDRRVRPGLDNKVLLGWNALFLGALTEAAAALDHEDWMLAARTNARFLFDTLRTTDGRFLRSWRAPYLAYAEDYAALLEAALTLAELDDHAWLTEARAVADELLRLFLDPDAGGFFTTGNDAEALVVRPKDVFDDATPSANALAANGLLRLSTLTGIERYAEPALAILEMLAGPMSSHPTGFAYLLGALERHVRAPIEIVIVGEPTDPRTRALRAEVTGRLVPGSVTLSAPAADGEIPLLTDRPARETPTAYVCEHYACREPVTTPEALRAQLDAVLHQ